MSIRESTPNNAAEIPGKERGDQKNYSEQDSLLTIRIRTKLTLIVSSIIIITLLITTSLGLYFYRRSLSIRAEDENISMSAIIAKQVDNKLIELINSANLLFQLGSTPELGGSALVDGFFANDSQLIYVGIPETQWQYSSRYWFHDNRIFNESVILDGILSARRDDFEKARNGETVIVNVSPLIPNLENPVLAIAVPFLLGIEQEYLVVLTDIGETLSESVRLQRGSSTIIVNPAGEILAASETSRVFRGDDIAGTTLYEKIYTEGIDFGQMNYYEMVEDERRDYIGFYRLIKNFNLGVITTTPAKDIFRSVQRIILLNLYFGLAILSISLMGVFFFARSISLPIKELWFATQMIKNKQWSEAITEPKTRDEVGILARNFNAMIPDLRATDDLLENTKRFINEDVAKMIYENRLPHTATTKDVTVLFSDVRNFTRMSEAMEDPQIVLRNLSEYFDAMVPCIRNTQGMVDKFIGDAIMAVWGSMAESLENNAESAINGALQMRKALTEFNRNRDKNDRLRPPYRFGCGLHSGPVTVGILGGFQKQEWAHIGSTVNIASRIEQANKELGTDILISPETASRIEGVFHIIAMAEIKPKGLETPIQIYSVLGRLDDESRPKNLKELQKRLGLESRQFTGNRKHDEKRQVVSV